MIDKYELTLEAPHNFLPKERLDYRLSRYALFELTSDDDLRIKNHHHLINSPQTLVSISHTKGLGAAFICRDTKYKSIGIDVEWTTRPIKKGIEKFYLIEGDSDQLSKLELWCIKEAAFKAFSPLYADKKTLVLKDFIVNENKVFHLDKEIGHYINEYKTLADKELLISRVYL